MVSGLVSYLLGAILESVFLFRVSVDRNLPVYLYDHLAGDEEVGGGGKGTRG